jgi:hypothetical protein
MVRHWFVFTAGLIAICLSGVAGAVMPQAPPRLVILIEGGFLHVFSDVAKTYEVGAMKSVTSKHPIWLTVNNGTAASKYLKPDQYGRFNLSDKVLTVSVPDVPTNGAPKEPPDSKVSQQLPKDWNDLAFIPDLVTLAIKAGADAKVALDPGWRSKVHARLVFTGGTLSVVRPRAELEQKALWQFRVPKTAETMTKHRQPIAATIKYELVMPGLKDQKVVLKGEKNDDVVSVASTDGISVTISAESPGGSTKLEPGDAFPHYDAFYDALTPVPGTKIVPHYYPRTGKDGISSDHCVGGKARETGSSQKAAR